MDRASNALGHGNSAVLIIPKAEYFSFKARLDFNYTNNVAGYEACAMGLQAAIDKKVKELKVYGDSALVIYQLRGEWEIEDSCLILYHKYIAKMIKQFNEINFNHLPREENQMVDTLTTLAAIFRVNSSDEVQSIQMRLKKTPAHYAQIEDEANGKPWYYDIRRYIKDQQYLEHASKNDKRILRRLVVGFLLD